MVSSETHLIISPLLSELTLSFRHAQAQRNHSESIWVKAQRGGIQGFGEGCPRIYVAGDDIDSSMAWLRQTFDPKHPALQSFDDMLAWSAQNQDVIKCYPSAWCALEMALLDLFARENNKSVEVLLGMSSMGRKSTYSAVLGVDKPSGTAFLAELYLSRRMHDVKIKLSGDLVQDQTNINTVYELAEKYQAKNCRIRLDANNLWSGQTDRAIQHIRSLKGQIFAVEEPVEAGNADANQRFGHETGLPVILDESLLTKHDLSSYPDVSGPFIANIKISRVGGLIRALDMIEVLKKKGWPVILGCHVGESSLLTRAALITAQAAGSSLTAHEGAFGDFLVSREPVHPMLRFDDHGQLDLDSAYTYQHQNETKTIDPRQWDLGFGMTEAPPCAPEDHGSRT